MTSVDEASAVKYPPPPPESPAERKGRMIALFVMPFLIVTMMYATYMGTMHDPQPRELPVGLIAGAASDAGSGVGSDAASMAAIARDLKASADGALDVRLIDDLAQAEVLIEEGEIAGAVAAPTSQGGAAQIYTASASGAAQGNLVAQLVAPYAVTEQWEVERVDLAPLPEGDGSGTAVLFAAMGLMLAGYVPLSALLLGTPNLTRVRRFMPMSLVWAAFTSSVVWLILGPIVGAIDGHYLGFVAIGTLAVMAVHTAQLLFTKILGPFAVLLGMLLWVIFGVPSSGLATPLDTMPGFFQWLHHVLPLPATGEALRSVLYYDGRGLGGHLVVLAAWLVGALALATFKERRSGALITGGPAYTDPDAPLPALAGGPVASYRRRVAAVVLFPLSIMVTVVTLMGLSMHQPQVHDMPVAVVGTSSGAAEQFISTVEPSLAGTADLRVVDSTDAAEDLIRSREVVAGYVLPAATGEAPALITAEGAGASQKNVATQIFEPIAAESGQSLAVKEIAPLTEDDSGGSNSMYVGMSWILAGFLFFAVMRGGAPDLTRTRQLLPLVAGWSVGISVWLWFLFDVLIGAVNGHAFELIGYGAITTFCSAWATAVLTRPLGLGALVPAMIAVMLAGVPASGGGLSLYMVPEFFGPLADILPLPAAVDIARSVVYFDGIGVGANLLVLAAWGAIGLVLNLLVVDPWLNRPGAKPHAPLGPKHGRAPSSPDSAEPDREENEDENEEGNEAVPTLTVPEAGLPSRS